MEIIQDKYARSLKEESEFFECAPDEKSLIKEADDGKWARCRSCSSKIALLSDQININHTDNHIFKNPAGVFFRVICFSNAPGSMNITEYVLEDTWFEGYFWSISLCRACNTHLGWHYLSGWGNFFGLIADRLTGI